MGASRELFIKEREANASRHDEDYHYHKWSLQNKANRPNKSKSRKAKKREA